MNESCQCHLRVQDMQTAIQIIPYRKLGLNKFHFMEIKLNTRYILEFYASLVFYETEYLPILLLRSFDSFDFPNDRSVQITTY